jgi:hypothetical protein
MVRIYAVIAGNPKASELVYIYNLIVAMKISMSSTIEFVLIHEKIVQCFISVLAA